MSLELHARIKNLKSTDRTIVPDSAWVAKTREVLLMQVKNTLPPEQKISMVRRVREMFRYAIPQELSRLVRRPILAALSVLTVAMGGSILSVSAAEQALPGDLQYGLKLASEQALIALTPASEDKLKLKT